MRAENSKITVAKRTCADNRCDKYACDGDPRISSYTWSSLGHSSDCYTPYPNVMSCPQSPPGKAQPYTDTKIKLQIVPLTKIEHVVQKVALLL